MSTAHTTDPEVMKEKYSLPRQTSCHEKCSNYLNYATLGPPYSTNAKLSRRFIMHIRNLSALSPAIPLATVPCFTSKTSSTDMSNLANRLMAPIFPLPTSSWTQLRTYIPHMASMRIILRYLTSLLPLPLLPDPKLSANPHRR
jgi:hypothetical protein